MNIEEIRDYIVALPEVEETNPFSDESEIAIYKIGGKWFAAFIFARPEYLAVKCDPDRALALRDGFPDDIAPAWHFNKRHWNDLRFAALPAEVVKREIRHSYLTVIRTNVTPRALRDRLLASAAGIADASPEL